MNFEAKIGVFKCAQIKLPIGKITKNYIKFDGILNFCFDPLVVMLFFAKLNIDGFSHLFDDLNLNDDINVRMFVDDTPFSSMIGELAR
ncbi:hypothetical protein BpHYR1_017810 [Brachionus plicatilis]|uniref:Uncharacterized protein n=1 Tax=Brachionus plicatilis TaxID=10195 RepID=A0A3M7RM39_BRAPC|nr:hypothetical protein BpHYR1_017810 [Brachionus plicatilis]